MPRRPKNTAPTDSPAKSKAKPRKRFDKLSRESYLRDALMQAEAAVDQALEAGSFQGGAGFKRIAKATRAELDALLEAKREKDRPLTHDELIEKAEVEAREMADAYLEIYVKAYLERHNARLVPRVIEGGKAAG
jgi:hypothetical protein